MGTTVGRRLAANDEGVAHFIGAEIRSGSTWPYSRHRADWNRHARIAVKYGSTQRNPAAGHVPHDAEPRGLNGIPKTSGRLKSHDDFEALWISSPKSRRPFVDFADGSRFRRTHPTPMLGNATSWKTIA
ncbi:MAG: hypothetical protein ACJ746_21435 [Bryobacteraceae bacterium]